MERPDAVLFDLDGTIIDSRVPFVTSMNHALAAHGQRPRDPAELVPYLGPPTRIALGELLGQDEALIDAVLSSYREHYARTSTETTLVYAGIPELLRALHGRARLAVATSKIATSARMLLEHLGLADLFDVISGPAPSALAEPKSVTVAQALAALGAAAGTTRAVMIGDRRYDVEGARAHDLPTIGVLWGAGSEGELRQAGAWRIVTAPAEIPPLLGLDRAG
ncbi:MAG TPA: HAD hydrolase-like protein [Solirubrobacteraceae bacterium]|nr:HAD hydrolase-like protein [Solirubrobacteraceae bacterium]